MLEKKRFCHRFKSVALMKAPHLNRVDFTRYAGADVRHPSYQFAVH